MYAAPIHPNTGVKRESSSTSEKVKAAQINIVIINPTLIPASTRRLRRRPWEVTLLSAEDIVGPGCQGGDQSVS